LRLIRVFSKINIVLLIQTSVFGLHIASIWVLYLFANLEGMSILFFNLEQ